MQRKPGCASGIALVVTDSESRIVQLQRAHNFLHLDRVRVSFAAAKHFSLAWDPSNYGGEHTMVTALYSWQPDLAAILHPKVTRCQYSKHCKQRWRGVLRPCANQNSVLRI